MCSSFSERNNSGPGGGRNVLAVCGSMCVGGVTRTFGAAAVCGEPCGEVVRDHLFFYALLMGLGVAGRVDVTPDQRAPSAPTGSLTAGDADTQRPAIVGARSRSGSGLRPGAPLPGGRRAPGASRTVPGPGWRPGQGRSPRASGPQVRRISPVVSAGVAGIVLTARVRPVGRCALKL
jgi:hypothetical protein